MKDYSPQFPTRLPEDIRMWARELRGHMTDAEALIWKLLRNKQVAGAKFRRQHPLGRYILDFYCDEKKLCIELDGSQHMDAVDYDVKRDAWLRTQGIRVLRFWSNQALTETEGVMEAIYEVLLSDVIVEAPSLAGRAVRCIGLPFHRRLACQPKPLLNPPTSLPPAGEGR
ncbi:MAG TPA: endonuclease domain-containing protein [Burkholderiales bacterium]|nr:endonuclease domain-containing protein [Burkholderiales bacterium]